MKCGIHALRIPDLSMRSTDRRDYVEVAGHETTTGSDGTFGQECYLGFDH
jgi:hypothetical protein